MSIGGGAQGPGVDPPAEDNATPVLPWDTTPLPRESQDAAPGPPPAGVRAARPVTVVLTAFNGRDSAGFSGQGGGLLEALMSAVGQAQLAAPVAGRLALDIIDGEATPLPRPAADG